MRKKKKILCSKLIDNRLEKMKENKDSKQNINVSTASFSFGILKYSEVLSQLIWILHTVIINCYTVYRIWLFSLQCTLIWIYATKRINLYIENFLCHVHLKIIVNQLYKTKSLIELIFNYNFNPINRFAASVDICLKRKRWQASITFPRHWKK
jgi:hypothetical protein